MDHERRRPLSEHRFRDTLVRVPAVLRAVTRGLQPARLLLALLVVAAIAAGGRTLDALLPEGVRDAAALVRRPGDGPVPGSEAADALLRATASHWVPDAAERLGAEPTPEAVLEAMALARREATGAALGDPEAYLAARASLARLVPRGPFAAIESALVRGGVDVVRAATDLRPLTAVRALGEVLVDVPLAVARSTPWSGLGVAAIALALLALGGGALCRMTACELAGRERLRVADAAVFAAGTWPHLLIAPVLPLVVAAASAGVLALAGLLARVPWLDVVAALLLGLGLLLALLAAFLLLGLAVGAPLLTPAIACERCDAIEAVQRAIAYAIGRPVHLVGTLVMIVLSGVLAYLLVALLMATALDVLALALSAGGEHPAWLWLHGASTFQVAAVDPGPVAAGGAERTASAIVRFWRELVALLVAAATLSVVLDACTRAYLLLREANDGQDPSEIWRPGLVPGTLAPVRGLARAGGAEGGDAD